MDKNNCVELEENCNRVSTNISDLKKGMRSFGDVVGDLEERRKALDTTIDEMGSMKGKYQLGEDELWRIEREEVGGPLFDVLEKIQTMKSELESLTSTPSSQFQHSAFKLLDELETHEEVAFRRLYQWVRKRCDSLESSEK